MNVTDLAVVVFFLLKCNSGRWNSEGESVLPGLHLVILQSDNLVW